MARLKRWLAAAGNDIAIIWEIEPRLFLWPLILLVFAIGLFIVPSADAASIPTAAEQHRRTLVRAAHAEWGLDAPIATLAAQVHQESAWRSDARSRVGAEGLAQFMPGTSAWMAELYPGTLGANQPYNPGWALRAMVTYNRWHSARISAASPCEKWAMMLSAYNGGLGWVNRDKRLASASGADSLRWFDHVERFNSGRSAANFRENRDYPRKILLRWEPMYVKAGWGVGVCADRYSRHETSNPVFADRAHRIRIACSVFPELAHCQRAVRFARATRSAADLVAAGAAGVVEQRPPQAEA